MLLYHTNFWKLVKYYTSDCVKYYIFSYSDLFNLDGLKIKTTIVVTIDFDASINIIYTKSILILLDNRYFYYNK